MSGINIDAGIFLSYVGLCSYYNYENWTDQASYVSSNTPWFFNGIRIQIFPTDKLKIEPWIINGWQSYGMFNEQPGLGFQIAWRPNGIGRRRAQRILRQGHARQSGPQAVPHRQQRAHQVLRRQPDVLHQQGGVLAHRRRRLRAGRRRVVHGRQRQRRRRSTSSAPCSTTGSGSTTTRSA